MTTTSNRRRANRLNAQKSTGPLTGQGRTRASLNRLLHGLRASTPVLPGEDPGELEALTNGVASEMEPQGVVEEFMAERVAMDMWRLRRAERAEFGDGFEADIGASCAWMRLRYTANGNPVDYRVRLTSTRPNFGGVRWWFLCPLVRADGGPSRRVAKLYLPPGQAYFGSQEGHGLTYTSCQESHDRLFRRLAAELGTSEATARWALKRPGGLLA